MRSTITVLIASAGLAGCVACGGSHQGSDRAADQSGNGGAAADTMARQQTDNGSGQPITLEGCVQRGGGTFSNGFMLTMLNEPPGSVGTAGSVTGTGSSVEREQLRYASRTYRLDPQGDVKLSDMVGRQVRVTGTVAEPARVPKGDSGKGDVGSNEPLREKTQNRDDSRDSRLEPNDVAKLNVTSASVLSDSCGDGSDHSNGAGATGGAAHR